MKRSTITTKYQYSLDLIVESNNIKNIKSNTISNYNQSACILIVY